MVRPWRCKASEYLSGIPGQLKNSPLHHLRSQLDWGCERTLVRDVRHLRALAIQLKASIRSARTRILPKPNNERTPDSLVESPMISPDRKTRITKDS